MVFNTMKKNLYIFSLILPVIMLLGLTIFPITNYYLGTDIKLSAKAYTSTDSNRGKGIYLTYDISNVKKEKISKDIIELQNKNNGLVKEAYISLNKNGDVYDVTQVVLAKPKSGIYLKCSVYLAFEKDEKNGQVDVVNLNIPIDNFYPSNKKEFISSEFKDETPVIATLRVYKGNAVLKDVVKK